MESPRTESLIVDSPPQEVQLSRAVSAVDLNASLTAVKEKPQQCLRHSREETPNTLSESRVEAFLADTNTPDGISTPPVPPNPPPPTPATVDLGVIESSNEKPQVCESAPTVYANANADQKSKKKKKKKKPAKKNNLIQENDPNKPKKQIVTGFEDYFADAPIRPDEYTEELELYDQSREFKDRMQSCIQRFRARRKLDQVRSNIFTKYLALGGVETGGKQFTGGLDRETIENSTASEIATIQATDFIRAHPQSSKFYDGSDKWVVDFEGVTKGFFSYRLAKSFPIDDELQLQVYCMVIRNFLNYVLYHKVCPEYTSDVIAAREITNLAENELWAIKKISSKLPGDFNRAASILFGGRYKNAWGFGYHDDGVEPLNDDDQSFSAQDFALRKAELIFMSAIAIRSGEEQAKKVTCSEVSIIKSEKRFFEVVEIQLPNSKIMEQYGRVKDSRGNPAKLKPLGAVKLKNWKSPGLEPQDSTDDESDTEVIEEESEWFWLEDEILQLFYISLKLEVEVKDLNIGIKYIDSFIGVFCSFFTFLHNEKMVGYREPAASTRPPPTEDDEDIDNKNDDDLEYEDD